MIYKDMNIRNHGEEIKVPISEIRSRRWMYWISVDINGERSNAGSITSSNLPNIGDSVQVCYIPGEYCVVQTSVNPNRYYLYFILTLFLLVGGLCLVIGGFQGKGLNKVYVRKTVVKIPKSLRRKNRVSRPRL
jgi:hypothetical protein